jgi:hypothetical protein
VRLLVRTRPDVDLPVVEVLALPVERSVVAGPCLDDEVVRLPEALHHLGGSVIACRHLVRHAAHEAALEPAARVHVDHGHLLGHAHGLAPVGDGIAEDEQARLARLAREDAHDDGTAGIEVGRGLVVLVDHDLEAHVLGDLPLVDEAVIEVGTELGIVVPIGQLHPDGVVLLCIGQQVVGVLAEEPGTHAILLYPGRASRKARTRATSASGSSRWGKCPAPGMV